MKKVYLDNCMFNRPFDHQGSLRIRLETEAKLHIQASIKAGNLALIWSYILDFENHQNPFDERRQAIGKWKSLSAIDVSATPALVANANVLATLGIRSKDALHVACALEAGADYFLSTDDKLLKKLTTLTTIAAMNPVDFIKVLEP